MPDMSLLGFIEHLSGFALRYAHEANKDLERAAKVIQRESRKEIGHYQTSAGPFVAWAELADATKDDRVKKGYTENDPELRSGELRDSIQIAVGRDEAAIGSNMEIAVFQELGTQKMPPRSFLGGAAVRKAERVAEILGRGVVVALVGHEVSEGRIPIESDH